jgi:tetratricopeptide (TPR) repeat protein
MRRWTYLICSALVLGSIATVYAGDGVAAYPACTGKPSATDEQAAKSLFTAGQVSFNEADYRTAITYWRDAFKRDCTKNALLLNLARAYELAGDKREAIAALRTYVDREPNSQDKGQIQRRIENLEAQQGPAPAPTAKPQPDAGAAPPPVAIGADGGIPPSPTPPTVPTTTAGSEANATPSRPITPWIVVGVGGVATIAGVLLWASGNSKIKDAEIACPDRNNCPYPDVRDKGNSGRSSVQIGGVLTGVGLVAVAGGLVWQFAFNKPKSAPASTPAATLTPAFGQGFSGLSMQGQF